MGVFDNYNAQPLITDDQGGTPCEEALEQRPKLTVQKRNEYHRQQANQHATTLHLRLLLLEQFPVLPKCLLRDAAFAYSSDTPKPKAPSPHGESTEVSSDDFSLENKENIPPFWRSYRGRRHSIAVMDGMYRLHSLYKSLNPDEED